MARGGNRTPRKPAPVSGSGAMSQRTDGGAGQPIRAATDQPYGARQATEAAQGAAPLAAGGGTPAPAPMGGPSGAGGTGSPLPPLDVFGATGRPNEPMNAGLDNQGQMNPDDPDMMLRLLVAAYPHPSLTRLLPEN